ncbi:MAG: sigma 54-interacting transcriptional regulator [Desulfobacterales bacterium]|nr:sigma 54-interacting transcriptional regulator [Desulfobacterales bacterium]
MRIISATNKNLPDMITQKQFREDLFFRINVIPIYLPPCANAKRTSPFWSAPSSSGSSASPASESQG